MDRRPPEPKILRQALRRLALGLVDELGPHPLDILPNHRRLTGCLGLRNKALGCFLFLPLNRMQSSPERLMFLSPPFCRLSLQSLLPKVLARDRHRRDHLTKAFLDPYDLPILPARSATKAPPGIQRKLEHTCTSRASTPLRTATAGSVARSRRWRFPKASADPSS